MHSALRLFVILVPFACAAGAQDVPGIEQCARETRMERRTGCLQSNIEYLHALIAKNAVAAQQRAVASAGEIAMLRTEVAALRAMLVALQARVEQLEAAVKARPAPAAPPEKPAVKQ